MRTYNRVTFIRNWVGFFILGTINNLPYVIVNSSAKVLVTSFGEANLVGVIPWANVSLNLFAKALNTFVLLKTPYGLRYVVVTFLMLFGLLGLSFSPSFILSILCIVIIGGCSGFGENLTLGYLHQFDSRLVNAWSSGTGMAGLLGATLYILFSCIAYETNQNSAESNNNRMKEMNRIAFWGTTPLILMYIIAYLFIISRPKSSSPQSVTHSDRASLLSLSTGNNINYSNSWSNDDFIITSLRNSVNRIHENKNENNFANRFKSKLIQYLKVYWVAFKVSLWLSINLSSVYFFEYLARVYSAKARPYYDYNPNCPELYSALQLCYQAGVFVSRLVNAIIE